MIARTDLSTNSGLHRPQPLVEPLDDESHPDYVSSIWILPQTRASKLSWLWRERYSKRLKALGVRPYLKTSGASGFHIYVPLKPEYTYEQARMFAAAIGQQVKLELPDEVTSERMVSSRRKGPCWLTPYRTPGESRWLLPIRCGYSSGCPFRLL